MLGNCFIEIITKGTREPFDWLKDGLMHYRIGEKSRQRNTLEVIDAFGEVVVMGWEGAIRAPRLSRGLAYCLLGGWRLPWAPWTVAGGMCPTPFM
jgi:hypothetical protein